MVDGDKPFGVVVNGLAHACVGMGAQLKQSNTPLRVVRCSQQQLRDSRESARSQGLMLVDFTQTMTGDTYVEQLQRTKASASEELEYYAVLVAGQAEQVAALAPTSNLSAEGVTL
ncbi:DUF2000 family protein [Aquabacterium sp. CECT 9606]|uniref:DUF2000 family protein n=1 Tax=Aquabacterium sp. CECT 9606 TaxID=2845822 RepID=UPI001E5CF085|nr:DUF2000 family protein [Aquabacterium sp. CECT 9606]